MFRRPTWSGPIGLPPLLSAPMFRVSLPKKPRSCHRLAVAVAVLACAGCAQSAAWKAPRMPWEPDPKAERMKEKYGLTADQRVESLVEQAKAAKKEGGHEAFTTELSRTILGEHDPRVRAEMLKIAAEFTTPAADAICRGGLEDPDERVRMAACDAWGARGGDEAVKLLTQRYQTDSEIDVRLRAIRMLGAVEDKIGRAHV